MNRETIAAAFLEVALVGIGFIAGFLVGRSVWSPVDTAQDAQTRRAYEYGQGLFFEAVAEARQRRREEQRRAIEPSADTP